jgi:hypothetical protein
MNFKSIKNFLKKNYKKIIVVCLIMLLLSNKMYENFDLGDTLNAVKAMETKFNNVFTKLEDQEVTIDKKLKVKNLCIGETCISEDQLKVLTGGKWFSIQSGRSNKRLQDNGTNARFENHNDKGHETLRIIKIRDKE